MARIALFLCLAGLLGEVTLAQQVYTYTREDGSRVYSNIGGKRHKDAKPYRGHVGATRRPGQEQVAASRPSPRLERLPGSDAYDDLISDISRQHGEDENLVKAIIAVESAFQADAVSVKNCKGLMQLHPDTARQMGVRDVFDPAQNIEGGVKYLKYLRKNFEDLDLVLAAYNAGDGAVRKYNGIPPYKETERYIEKVRALYEPALQDNRSVRRNTIFRVVMPDGSILLTNTPSREVSSQSPTRPRSRVVNVDLTGGPR
ncbi:MAG TPA: lytic transglycosylase domain-containing protein [Acidobacteriota bacterium]|nr:lytic transglycosylase domain-containing protein [Acidobacteriota bacterium]